jgi:hypothetical protein
MVYAIICLTITIVLAMLDLLVKIAMLTSTNALQILVPMEEFVRLLFFSIEFKKI